MPPVPVTWPTTRQGCLERHGAIAVELADLHRELGNVLATEREAKITTALAAEGTDRYRENAAGFNALESTKAVFDIRGNIAALEEERDHLRYLLAHGVLT